MPIPVPNLPFQNKLYEIENFIQQAWNGTNIDKVLIRGYEMTSNSSSTVFNYEQFNNNKKFLKLQSNLKKQIEAKKEFYRNISSNSIESEFALCTNDLFEIKPDLISVELTTEQSLFYTIKKNSFTLFFQHFLFENNFNDVEESLLSVFNNDSKLPSIEGDRSTVISHAKRLVLQEHSYIDAISQ